MMLFSITFLDVFFHPSPLWKNDGIWLTALMIFHSQDHFSKCSHFNFFKSDIKFSGHNLSSLSFSIALLWKHFSQANDLLCNVSIATYTSRCVGWSLYFYFLDENLYAHLGGSFHSRSIRVGGHVLNPL